MTPLQAFIGLVVLLVAVLAVVLLVPRAFGGDEADQGSAPTRAATGTTAPATNTTPAATSTAPAAPATTTSTGTTASSAPAASSTPAPAGGNAAALPAGWHLYEDPSGFTVPVPNGWRISHQGSEVYFQENGGRGRLLIVDQTRNPKPDPVKDWQSVEAARRGSYRDYQRIGIREVSYWDKAADWEYLRTSDRGNRLHTVKRGFITAKDQAYGITWVTLAEDWNANKDELALIYKDFRPARS